MHVVLSVSVLSVVLFVFGFADAFLLRELGLCMEYSRVLHGIVTSFFILENWSLVHELEQMRAIVKGKESSTHCSAQGDFMYKLMVQNSMLEQRYIKLQHKLNAKNRRSSSLDMD
jgi:hypothetical protein